MVGNWKENFLAVLIRLSAAITFISIIAILSFVFIKGISKINVDFFVNNYDDKTAFVNVVADSNLGNVELEKAEEGFKIVKIDNNSYLTKGHDKKGSSVSLKKGDVILAINGEDVDEYGEKEVLTTLNDIQGDNRIKILEMGGGIYPMIISTFIMIGLSLIISVPIGVFSAIYLTEYAKRGKGLAIIRFSIEVLSGIPSIVYGLFGMLLFVTTLGFNYSIMAGALTVSIILLPIIIRTTEESLKTVPESYREASLGLGATKLQTIFKVIIPSSISGIITAIILSVGRIVGESAALILTAGTVARIPNGLFTSASTLTVKAFVVAKEEGNIEFACAIGIVIILLVMLINIMTKSVNYIFNRNR